MIVDQTTVKFVDAIPDHDDWSEYVEVIDEDGEPWWHDYATGYILGPDEFWGDDEDPTEYEVQECNSVECNIEPRHWTVYHRATGVGVKDTTDIREAYAEWRTLNGIEAPKEES